MPSRQPLMPRATAMDAPGNCRRARRDHLCVTTMRWTTCGAAILAGLLAGSAALGQDAPMFRGNLAHTGVYDVPPSPDADRRQMAVSHRRARDLLGRLSRAVWRMWGARTAACTRSTWPPERSGGHSRRAPASRRRPRSMAAECSSRATTATSTGSTPAPAKCNGSSPPAGERRFAGKHLHGFLPAGETMPDPFDVFLSSPAVSNGTVYIGSGDGNVYALNEQIRHSASGHSTPATSCTRPRPSSTAWCTSGAGIRISTRSTRPRAK